MRQKRAKAYKKLMATYERVFGFRTPYQVLYSSDFLAAAHSMSIDIARLSARTVSADIKGMISQCCIKTLYDAKNDSVTKIAKGLERRRCGHVEVAKSEGDCILECVGNRNKNRYIVATQDRELRDKLRAIPGVPLIYINRAVMILEPPSPATIMTKEERERGKVGLSAEEAAVLGKRKRVTKIEKVEGVESATETKKRKRGPKEPNPLAVKKAKPVKQEIVKDENEDVKILGNVDEASSRTRKKRSRRHKKSAKDDNDTDIKIQEEQE